MFTTAEKATTPVISRSQENGGRAFFRKADEEGFFSEPQQSTFFSSPVQAKLAISHADDPQEKEADSVAGQVMRMQEPVSIQTQAAGEEEKLNRSAVQRASRGPPSSGIMNFENNLSNSKGSGSPLPSSTQQFMESRFQADFSGVRIHTGSYAENLSDTINAQAFTHGRDIYFNAGKFSPQTEAGGTLLAHELTHTIQQGAVGTVQPSPVKEDVQRKDTVQRAAEGPVPQLTNAVEKAKSKEGKVNAAKEGPDGYREGWTDLLDFFKSTFGPDKIISGAGGTATPGTVAEQDIKKKRTATGMIVNKDDVNGDRITGERDAMPSWCGIFVFWALNTSGVPMPKWALGKSVIKPEAAYPGGYVPRAGDIAYKEGYSHFAIVESATGSTVRTVNGNTAGEDNLGGQIQARDHPISNWTAFFNPLLNMEGTLGSGEGPVDEKPKTLRELRRELFQIDRKEESEPEETKAPVAKEINTEEKEEKIQGGWFDDAISLVNSAIDYVAEGLEAGKRLLLGEARDFVMAIPGYKALRVVLGEDPITGEEIDRNGKNFIEAAFEIMPGGNLLYDKLNELGAIDEAAQWIDTAISAVESLVAGVITRVEVFWNGLSLDSLASPTQIFRDAGDIIHGTITRIIDFAIDTGKQLLEIVKKWLLTQVVGFIKERTTAYPLLTVILGMDPITEVEVDRNGTNILNALLELGGEEGKQQRTQMQETGTFEKVAAWIDQGILVFGNLYQTIRDNFGLIWSVVSIEALMHPVDKFTEIYNTFARPVADVLQFVADTAKIILQFIKEVLVQRLSEWAKEQRGYFLLTVILGKDPFTDARVARSTENIIRGFMGLMDGGEEQFAQMKESGAIGRAVAQIDAAVDKLNMTPEYIVQLFIGLWKGFGLSDLAEPVMAFMRIIDTLSRPIQRLISFVVEIVKILVIVILEIMQFPFDLINNIIAKTVKSFHLIKSDPIGFLKNLLRAIKEGFIQFFDNILQHLVNGLVGWLTMELKDAGVPELKDLSLKGIIGWVLEVLGITMDKIWQKLEKHPKVGPAKVAKMKGMINTLEGIWTFIKDVRERGMAAIWDKIQEQLSNLWNVVLDSVKNWIMEKIITQITVKLLSMLDPTGIMAVVNSCIAIYKAIQSFIKYLRQMLEILNSFVEGVAEIATGATKKAADFLERTLAKGIPIVIGFLANQLSLSGIGKKIGEMIEKVRTMVDKALDWLVNKAVDVGGKLLDMGKAAVSKVLGWLGVKKEFTATNGETHELYFEGTNDESAELWVASRKPQRYSTFLANINTVNDPAKAAKKQEALTLLAEVQAAKRQPLTPGMPEEQARTIKYDLVNTKVIALSVPTAHLFGGPLKPLEFAFGSVNAAGLGSNMTIRNLNKNNRPPVGGPPGITNDTYRKLNLRRNGATTYYIKGHLLNGYLGGTGSDFRNLTPLSRDGNGNHERQVEKPVIDNVDAGKTVEYIVTPSPGAARNISDAQLQAAGIDQSDWGTMRDIVSAENSVPRDLQCVANVLNDTTGQIESSIVNTNVPNPVEYSLSEYEI
jgi:hypothetical protein